MLCPAGAIAACAAPLVGLLAERLFGFSGSGTGAQSYRAASARLQLCCRADCAVLICVAACSPFFPLPALRPLSQPAVACCAPYTEHLHSAAIVPLYARLRPCTHFACTAMTLVSPPPLQ
jgi:hypothetical protein